MAIAPSGVGIETAGSSGQEFVNGKPQVAASNVLGDDMPATLRT
jgi:hypothetical protein